jgi:hypothetical protein
MSTARKLDAHPVGSNPVEMAWLDVVVASPLIGLRMPNNWDRFYLLNQALGPFLHQLTKSGKTFQVQTDSGSNTIVQIANGFNLNLGPDSLTCGFKYPVAEKRDPGGLAIKSVLGDLQPFSALIEEVSDLLVMLAGMVRGVIPNAPLRIDRVGVAATFVVASELAPPGLTQILSDLAQPWGGSLRLTDYHVIVPITEGGQKQCHIKIRHSTDANDLNELRCQLDWQEHFPELFDANPRDLQKHLDSVRANALDFFERVGKLGTNAVRRT